MFSVFRNKKSALQFSPRALGAYELPAVVSFEEVKKISRQAVKPIVLAE